MSEHDNNELTGRNDDEQNNARNNDGGNNNEEQKASEEVLEVTLQKKIDRDLKVAVTKMGKAEVRFLVDYYYQMQEMRKSSDNQVRATTKDGQPIEPNEILKWFGGSTDMLEDQVEKALMWYVEQAGPLADWSISNYGIAHVITAGLLAHIDLKPWICVKARANKKPRKDCNPQHPCTVSCGVEFVKYAGQIWSFAGLSVGQKWEKGKMRPWNADLKTLCWKIGQSFFKFHNSPKCFYGHLFKQRWELEKERNERLLYKDQAAQKLRDFDIGKKTDAYASYSVGKLPPAHILARAQRWATKIFLSHYHQVAYEIEFGEKIPKHFVVEHLGHAQIIEPPNWPLSGKRQPKM